MFRSQVIRGWDEGVPKLSIGEKANLICTPDYGMQNPSGCDKWILTSVN